MKKILTTVITALLAVSVLLNVCILFAVVKEEKLNLWYDESAIVSIYEIVRQQDESGVVTQKDLKLYKTEKVLPTQMIKLPGNLESCWYDVVVNERKNTAIYEDGVYFFPEGDKVIRYYQAQKKDITFYLNGQNIYDKLTDEEKTAFDEYFKDTYNYEFRVPKEFVKETLVRLCGGDFEKIELYTNSNFSGEPFEYETFYENYYGQYEYYDIGFELIRSTSVYIKITK